MNVNWKEFYQKSLESIAFTDGSMGVLLQKFGLGGNECPEEWNLTHPDVITGIHRSYIEAGSELIITNTFGGNRIKLSEYGLEKKIKEINAIAVKLAKEAAGGRAIVAGDVGPTGKLIKPLGVLTFDEAVEVYKEQIAVLANAGADCIFFETHIDILELKAGIIACREVCDLPIIASVTFEKDGRMVTGTTPEAAFTTMEALGVDVIGTNCGTGASDMLEVIKKVEGLFSVPIVAQANAGKPRIEKGQTVFDELPEIYVESALKMIEHGVCAIGGCCGTTPEHIKLLTEKTKQLKPYLSRRIKGVDFLKLSSRFLMHRVGFDKPFTVIGERLNPTARKRLSQDILDNKFTYFREEAQNQEIAGAHLLDLNMGIAGQDEAKLMEKGIEILSTVTNIPVSIDTANSKSAIAGLRIYPGKPLLNSVSAELDRLSLLKEVKKYGAAFIALPIDEKGIPETYEERIKLMKKILDEASNLGIDKKNILADPLVLTVSSSQNGIKETLKTIRRYKEELGLYTTMGLSNVSYGLPARGYVNRAFLAMAIEEGLTSAIVNPLDEDLMGIIKASDVLLGKDINSEFYVNYYAKKEAERSEKGTIVDNRTIQKTLIETKSSEGIEDRLYQAVLRGNKEIIASLVKEALNQNLEPTHILNSYLIPAITEVGNLYEKRIYFLPQLILSAEAMKAAFSVLEPMLKKDSARSYGKIVFATVKGDVHDIGKNIVILLLKNYGFEVIDLGKDVPSEKILQTAVKEKANVVALSALMTTTMPRMKEFIELMKKNNFSFPVMVGGAAVTREYAEEIGAYYSVDAIGAVREAKKILGV